MKWFFVEMVRILFSSSDFPDKSATAFNSVSFRHVSSYFFTSIGAFRPALRGADSTESGGEGGTPWGSGGWGEWGEFCPLLQVNNTYTLRGDNSPHPPRKPYYTRFPALLGGAGGPGWLRIHFHVWSPYL